MKLLELFTFSHQTNRDAVSKVAIYFCFRFRTLEKVSKFTLLTNKHDDWEVEGYEKRSLLVICCQEFWQKMPPQKDHNYGILLFLDRQESYHHICIITGKVSLQGLDGFFWCLSQGWVETVVYLSIAFRPKAQEPVIIVVMKQMYVFLSHCFVRFYYLLTIQDWLIELLCS